MMKAVVVLFTLSAIAFTAYGAPAADIQDGDAVAKAAEMSGLVTSGRHRDLQPGMKHVAEL